MTLEVVFEDSILVAVNKPHGLLVHRTRIAGDVDEFALQMVRDQTGQKVYPVHRLDRKTSGILVFAKSPDNSGPIQQLFAERKVRKSYIALVRGYIPAGGSIDYPLSKGKKSQPSLTHFDVAKYYEVPWTQRNFKTSRYTLIKVQPLTGRTHQIRRHLAHIRHPIIGDRPHGCNKQNRLWKEKLDMITMLLHASTIEFKYQGKRYDLQASISDVFAEVLQFLKAYEVHPDHVKR